MPRPQAAPGVATPRVPGVRPSAPGIAGRPQQLAPGQPSALNRTQIRQLRREENTQVRQLQAQQRQQLRDLRTQGQRPDINALRQMRTQNTQQIRDLRQQFRDRRQGVVSPQVGALRHNGKPRVTPEFARQGRFASHFRQQAHPPRWRADHIPAHQAWRRHHHAGFVAWAGPVFWPYAYTDLFYYPFWPGAYDDAYWPNVYDDFFDSIYWATGNPYSASPYAAPTAVSVSRPPSRNRRQAADAASICASGGGVTAWPFARIESLVNPTAEQQALLDELKAAAAQASDQLKASCPQAAALTPTGRIETMIARLQATAQAVHTVRVSLMKFYDSLSDEQKARFNAIGPNAGPNAATAGITDANACAGQKPGLADLPIERVEDVVRPSDQQQAKLDQLSQANDQAIAILQAACPDGVPQTPVGRLDAMEKRLDAMIQAAATVQPALQDFYGSLTDEQKSRFNTLGQEARR